MISSVELYRKYARHLANLQKAATNLDKAYSKKLIIKRDTETCFEGIFLQAVVQFELFIEQLFVGMLCNKVSHASAQPIISIPSYEDAIRIIRGQGSNYIDWLPYSKTKERSEIFFKENKNPFINNPDQYAQYCKQILCIRNYIAHKSDHAKKQLQKQIYDHCHLMPQDKNLYIYFKTSHSVHVNKFEYHLNQLNVMARDFTT